MSWPHWARRKCDEHHEPPHDPTSGSPEIAEAQPRHVPFWQTYRVIDGRQEIMAHGNRDMPIWGDTFSRQEDGGLADETRAVGRILQLLYYLESIQEK